MNSNFCFRNELVQQMLIKQKFLLPSDKSKDHLSTDKNCSQFKRVNDCCSVWVKSVASSTR